MGHQQVQAARTQMASHNIPSTGQTCTVVAIDNTTGKNVQRQFPNYQALENWLATDAAALNLEIVRIS